MIDLRFAPQDELSRVLALDARPADTAEVFADLCRINALYMIARAGSGHIGSSFSCLDVVSWLYLHELRGGGAAGGDLFFSSKGHDAPALYAVLTALGRLPFGKIHELRRLNGLPGHPDVSIPGIAANTGSLGMGVSKAKGMLLANRLLGRDGRVFVLTGDGELQEGQFWESLVSAANRKLGRLTVIVDHNKIQSDTWVSRVSDLGSLTAKLESFGWHVARVDGHDMAAIASTLEALRDAPDTPKIVVADTVKGRGVSFMEGTSLGPADRLYRYHSGAPDDATYQRAIAALVERVNGRLARLGAAGVRLEARERPARPAPAAPQRLVAAYGRALVDQARRNPRIVAFDADLALDTGLLPFEEAFPSRFVECGIAEQDMVSQAGGAALQGLLPAVHSFACFLSDRPNEQIYNNATERTKIVYVGSLAGLLPGGPGHSHQCVRDIAVLSAVPGLVLIEPCCEREVELAVEYCFEGTEESCYLRLVSVPWETGFDLPGGYALQPGRGVTIVDGTDAMLFGYGPILLGEAVRAAALLRARHGISAAVVNLPWLNRVDAEWLASTIGGAAVFALDNHYTVGGQGDMILRTLAEHAPAHRCLARRIGVVDIPACGTNDEVLRAHGLHAEGMAAAVALAMRGRATV
ncbi:MAG: transketolase [Acidobacteria bacterium]|nr:transketolase [Acidobacteriota bacterium]